MAPSWNRRPKIRPTRFILLSILIVVSLWLFLASKTEQPSTEEPFSKTDSVGSAEGSPVQSEPESEPESEHESEPEPEPEPVVPTYEVWGIENMEAQVKLSTVHIKTVIEQGFRAPIEQKIDLRFSFKNVDATKPLPNVPVREAIVQVAEIEKVDASEIIFGIGTKLDRLRDSLQAISHWASGTNAHIIAMVQPPDPENPTPTKKEVTEMYQQRNIKITIIESKLDWVSQIVALPGIIYDRAVAGVTKWACIMDDDTYFFSMKNVLTMLDKYNHNRPYYVGGISENKESWDRLGYFAYGGAGIFLSMPLLKEMRPRVDECVALPDHEGDERLGTCIMNFTTTKFTWDHKLFQVDLHGDVTGFYEAPRERPVSTHHWKSWHHHDMAQVGEVSKVCGNECVLQKYNTRDDWVITNGFSVVKYSYTRSQRKTHVPGAMEHTWDHTAWVIPNSWKYTLYPLKPKDPGKQQFVIEKAVETDKEVTQYYVQRQGKFGKGIIKMVWSK